MNRTLLTYWNAYKALLAATAGMVLLFLFLFSVGITCPIKFVTGISCPGCGMSRACFAALRGEFAAAFAYHPLWFLLPVAFPTLIVLKRKDSRMFLPLLITAAAVMIAVWCYRLLFVDTAVVVCDPANNLFARLLRWIGGGTF